MPETGASANRGDEQKSEATPSSLPRWEEELDQYIPWKKQTTPKALDYSTAYNYDHLFQILFTVTTATAAAHTTHTQPPTRLASLAFAARATQCLVSLT